MSGRFNGIGGFPRGDKGRIETSLVPPWKNNREDIILFNKIINTNAINKIVYIALSKRQISICQWVQSQMIVGQGLAPAVLKYSLCK